VLELAFRGEAGFLVAPSATKFTNNSAVFLSDVSVSGFVFL